MTRACEQCGKPFESLNGRKRYCGSSCRARRAEGVPATTAAVVAEPPVQERFVHRALLQDMRKAGVDVDSWEAAQMLQVAEWFDDPSATPAAMVAYSKEMRRMHDKVFGTDAPTVTRRRRGPVPPDELAVRREHWSRM